MVFFWCRSNAKGSGPLLTPISRRNYRSNTTRERMAGNKPRTHPYSVHIVYGEVPAKICHNLFCKSVDCGKQDSVGFSKIWGQLTRKKRHVNAPHPGKVHGPKLSFLPCTSKGNMCKLYGKCMHLASTGYVLHLEAWDRKNSGAVSSR